MWAKLLDFAPAPAKVWWGHWGAGNKGKLTWRTTRKLMMAGAVTDAYRYQKFFGGFSLF